MCKTKPKYLGRLFLALLLWPGTMVYALTQHEKLWVGANAKGSLSADKKWSYLLYTQSRFINKSHPWSSSLFEGGVGYSLSTNQQIWLGYRWGANQPNNGFFQENRLWQAFDGTLKDADNYKIYSRSRLEETSFSNRGQISCRLRQRVLILGENFLYSNIRPQLYDEAFFQLNRTDYTTHQFLSENRIFLGARILVSDKKYWEVGYINQYLFALPYNSKDLSQTQNQMNHVVSINYNYI